MKLKGKKAQEAERPDPDADYEDDDMPDYDLNNDDEGEAGSSEEADDTEFYDEDDE